jgi:acyl-CoA thioester hydrolase
MPTDPDIPLNLVSGDPDRLASQGWMAGNVHVYPVRIYYEDTDVGGVVYYANYLKFAERARTEMLRLMGYSHAEMMERDGCALAVRRCEADYIRPARFDDSLEVHTNNLNMEAASLWLDQRVKRAGDELAFLRIRLACIGKSGKPARLPARLRSALMALAGATGAANEDGPRILQETSIRERV